MKHKEKKSDKPDHEAKLISVHKGKPTSVKQVQTPSSPDVNEYTGLCVNCNKRTFCRFCNQPGGVWYCEEYE